MRGNPAGPFGGDVRYEVTIDTRRRTGNSLRRDYAVAWLQQHSSANVITVTVNPPRSGRHRGTGADVYGYGRWQHEHYGHQLALHVFVHSAGDNRRSKSNGEDGNLHQWRDIARRDGHIRYLGDFHDERVKRFDLYRADTGEFSESRSDSDVHCNGRCGHQENRHGNGWVGFGNSRFRYAINGDRSGGVDADSNGNFQCIVSEFTAAGPAMAAGATKLEFFHHERSDPESTATTCDPPAVRCDNNGIYTAPSYTANGHEASREARQPARRRSMRWCGRQSDPNHYRFCDDYAGECHDKRNYVQRNIADHRCGGRRAAGHFPERKEFSEHHKNFLYAARLRRPARRSIPRIFLRFRSARNIARQAPPG